MLSDAELRELEIQTTRMEIERHEEKLKDLIESKNGFDADIVIMILHHERDILKKLELEAADDLEMIRKLKEGDKK